MLKQKTGWKICVVGFCVFASYCGGFAKCGARTFDMFACLLGYYNVYVMLNTLLILLLSLAFFENFLLQFEVYAIRWQFVVLCFQFLRGKL